MRQTVTLLTNMADQVRSHVTETCSRSDSRLGLTPVQINIHALCSLIMDGPIEVKRDYFLIIHGVTHHVGMPDLQISRAKRLNPALKWRDFLNLEEGDSGGWDVMKYMFLVTVLMPTFFMYLYFT